MTTMHILLLFVLGIVLFSDGCWAAAPKNKLLNYTQLVDNAYWVYYYGPDSTTSISVGLFKLPNIINDPHFNKSNPTFMYIHGWKENLRQNDVELIPRSYASRGGWNVILLDYDSITDGDYIIVDHNAIKLCQILGEILLEAFRDRFLDIKKFHLAGHSLGADCASIIGQKLINGGKKLLRITGMDPAGPLWYKLPHYLNVTRLSYLDATFVDIIHTDDYVFGNFIQSGTADFYPNGGVRYQPGCPTVPPLKISDPLDYCSHQKSVIYYGQSVSLTNNEPPFYAVSANSWQDFINHTNIDYADIVRMGIDCPMTARGEYFLQTIDTPEMSRGIQGINYDENA